MGHREEVGSFLGTGCGFSRLSNANVDFSCGRRADNRCCPNAVLNYCPQRPCGSWYSAWGLSHSRSLAGPEPAARYPTGHGYRPTVFCAQVTCALVLEGHTYATTKLMAVRSSWALPQPLRTVVPGSFSIRQKLPLALLIPEKGQK